jgi:ribosomal protein L32
VICEDCGLETAEAPFCIRCGHRQHEALVSPAKRRYSADPDETAFSLHVTSTLFPQLPRDDLAAFRLILLLGIGAVVTLAVLGLFPVAVVAAAALVPLVMVTYVYDVDLYEDEPLRVYALTLAWGAAAGAAMGLFLRATVESDPLGPGPDATFIVLRGVAVPLLSVALMLVGPLVLLPYRRFNDVLDGASFGATSAVAFVGAQVVAQSIDLFGAGLRPGGDSLLWIARLLTHGVALPLVAAGAVGAICGALWLRYRAPVRDRTRLGPLGAPVVALLAGASLFVAATLALLLLREIPALVVVTVLALVALVWLRMVIHLGLLQESMEIPVGDAIVCTNCHHTTLTHTFCGNCGVALRALPKDARSSRTVTPAGP